MQAGAVQSGTGLVEPLALIGGVLVQPNYQTRAPLHQQHTEARFLSLIMREFHRYPVRAQQPLVPGEAGFNVADGERNVVYSRDGRNRGLTHGRLLRLDSLPQCCRGAEPPAFTAAAAPRV